MSEGERIAEPFVQLLRLFVDGEEGWTKKHGRSDGLDADRYQGVIDSAHVALAQAIDAALKRVRTRSAYEATKAKRRSTRAISVARTA